MSAIIVDGKSIADTVMAGLRVQTEALGEPLHLAAVCAGDDAGLQAFVKLKQKAAQKAGMTFSSYLFGADQEQDALTALRYLAADESVHGIFIELPLPQGWDLEKMLSYIPPEKDVDALVPGTFVSAPAVVALQYVLRAHAVDVRGMTAAVIGHGRLVGRPIAEWLSEQGTQVRVIEVDTPNPTDISATADLVIAGTGRTGLVTAEWIKEGAVVVDFGYGKNKNGAPAGDVDMDSVIGKAGLLTPVPGGMGPLVIAAVLENLLTLAQR